MSDLVPAPDFGYTTSPKRVLWKWSVAAAAAILVFLMWQCGSALQQGRGLANAAVRHFHQELNSGNYEHICQGADEGFSQGEKHDELLRLLEAVHRKLGDAGDESQVNMNVNATTDGTFITTEYNTRFAQGQAIETFTWVKSGGTLKLYGYNVQSKALLN
jgi:hypothetical protein